MVPRPPGRYRGRGGHYADHPMPGPEAGARTLRDTGRAMSQENVELVRRCMRPRARRLPMPASRATTPSRVRRLAAAPSHALLNKASSAGHEQAIREFHPRALRGPLPGPCEECHELDRGRRKVLSVVTTPRARARQRLESMPRADALRTCGRSISLARSLSP